MTSLPPDSHALVLAQRNFEALPQEVRNRWAQQFMKARGGTLLPWPERVIIELANTCNLDCPMCRVGSEGVNLARVMPLDVFKRLAAQLFPRVREVRLNGLGESTLIPDFESYLDVLASYPVYVELITNGTGAEPLYRRMVEEGAILLFSWDAAEPALFERLRRPARWNELASIIQTVARGAQTRGQSHQLHLLFTLQGANRTELPRLVDLAAQWGVPHVVVNVVKQNSDSWLASHMEEILSTFREAEARALRQGIRLFLPDSLAGTRVELASACRTAASGCDRPWKEVVIRWDLDVQVCNMFNPYTYGNLALRPFEDLWQGAFATVFRNNLHSSGSHPYCKGCYYLGDVYAHKRG